MSKIKDMRLTKELVDNYPNLFINGKVINDYIKSYYPQGKLGLILFKADAKRLNLGNLIDKLNLYNNKNNNIIYNINLIGDAKSTLNRFAICSEIGKPLYYGKFFEGVDTNFDESSRQNLAELYTLKYAFELIYNTCIKYKINPKKVHLSYFTDSTHLAELNLDKVTYSSSMLKVWKEQYGIKYDLYWIRGIDNCADVYTLGQNSFLYPQLELTKNCFEKL